MGPILELALASATTGKRIYMSFAFAGLGCNLAAFVTRAAPKLLGMEAGRGKPFAAWAPTALMSYAICGILAGLISAWICFRVRSRDGGVAKESDTMIYVGIDDTDVIGTPGTNQLAKRLADALGDRYRAV